MSVTMILLCRTQKVDAVGIALAGIAVCFQVLVMLPLPNVAYSSLKHVYRLKVGPNQLKARSDTTMRKRVKMVDEAVYECDTNLPIRLLFILNSMPLLSAKTPLNELKFASGKPRDLAEKLLQLDRVG